MELLCDKMMSCICTVRVASDGHETVRGPFKVFAPAMTGRRGGGGRGKEGERVRHCEERRQRRGGTVKGKE